jgi:type I restriction enzyme M protein
VQTELAAYLGALRNGQPTDQLQPTCGLIVAKEQIAANGDYNLSGERYRERGGAPTTFPRVRLANVCESILTGPFGSSLHQSDYVLNGIPVINPQNIVDGVVVKDSSKTVSLDTRDRLKEFTLRENDIVIARRGEMGRCAIVTAEMNGWLCGTGCFVIRVRPAFDVRFVLLQLTSSKVKTRLEEQAVGVTLLNLNQGILSNLEIPLPPLDVQKEIVAEIEGYQKVINGARAVLDNYRPHVPIHPDWPMVRLADVCETITDGDHQPPPKAKEGVPFVTITNIDDDHELDFTKTFFVPETYYENLSPSRKPRKGDILYSVTGSYGIAVMVRSDRRFCFQRHIAIIRPAARLNNVYLHSLLSSSFMLKQGHETATGVAQKTVSLSSLRNFRIPLPSLATQQQIVAEIEAERTLVAANRELITRFEQKIQATLTRIWGEKADAVTEA